MSGGTTGSTSNSTVASRIAAQIDINGFTATSSGSTGNITGPLRRGLHAGHHQIRPQDHHAGVIPPNPPFTKVVVSTTSSPTGRDERQNFAIGTATTASAS